MTNPGRLLFDSSKFGKLSVARNPILFDAFHRLGITEKIGSGIGRMREAMAERNIEVEFDTGDFFIVTLARQTVTAQVLNFCQEPRKSSEIMELIGLKHWKTFQTNYLKPLFQQGLLAMTIPEKSTSSEQRYITTEAGNEVLKT
ncbi:MAG: ATP-binding protein [Syntrophales bacterium]|nr:ATP-binding protein [Syntrophales bacterium]